MPIDSLLLVAATLLVALATGIVFAFAVVVMPGLATLRDREFLTGYKVIDRIIQNNDPLFMIVWVGSVVLLIAAVTLNVTGFEGTDRWLLMGALGLYLLGVQAPTAAINVPLNNRLQAVDLEALDSTELASEREAFEARWVFWNRVRTVFGVVTVVMLLVVLA